MKHEEIRFFLALNWPGVLLAVLILLALLMSFGYGEEGVYVGLADGIQTLNST